MLGAIAPDSVHFRENYNSDIKKKSHLCVGDEKWGRVTNNQEWLKNVLSFLQENKNMEKGMGSIYHEESYAMDYALYLLNPNQKAIWEMLENATGYDIPNVVYGDEINNMKQDILHSQFLNRESVDVSSNKYVTLYCIQEFISVESQYIKSSKTISKIKRYYILSYNCMVIQNCKKLRFKA